MSASKVTPPRKQLRAFIDSSCSSIRGAALAIGISHPVLIRWLDGHGAPNEASRLAIERWTDGAIASSSWATPKERARLDRAMRVLPFKASAA